MKKFILLLSLFVFTLVSCEGPMGPPGERGEKGDKGDGMNWFVETYTAKASQWELVEGKNELNSFYRYEIVIPDLDNFVYEEGNVFCYMFQTVEGVEVQTPLTYNYPQGDLDENNKDYLFSEIYFFDYTEGSVMIYAYRSDFMTENRPPTTDFRVVLNW